MTGQTPEVGPIVRQIGIGADGQPLYAYRDPTPVATTAPGRPALPVSAYVALGVGASVGITAMALAAAVLAVAVAIGAVSVTISILVLRQMWERYAADRAQREG